MMPFFIHPFWTNHRTLIFYMSTYEYHTSSPVWRNYISNYCTMNRFIILCDATVNECENHQFEWSYDVWWLVHRRLDLQACRRVAESTISTITIWFIQMYGLEFGLTELVGSSKRLLWIGYASKQTKL